MEPAPPSKKQRGKSSYVLAFVVTIALGELAYGTAHPGKQTHRLFLRGSQHSVQVAFVPSQLGEQQFASMFDDPMCSPARISGGLAHSSRLCPGLRGKQLHRNSRSKIKEG